MCGGYSAITDSQGEKLSKSEKVKNAEIAYVFRILKFSEKGGKQKDSGNEETKTFLKDKLKVEKVGEGVFLFNYVTSDRFEKAKEVYLNFAKWYQNASREEQLEVLASIYWFAKNTSLGPHAKKVIYDAMKAALKKDGAGNITFDMDKFKQKLGLINSTSNNEISSFKQNKAKIKGELKRKIGALNLDQGANPPPKFFILKKEDKKKSGNGGSGSQGGSGSATQQTPQSKGITKDDVEKALVGNGNLLGNSQWSDYPNLQKTFKDEIAKGILGKIDDENKSKTIKSIEIKGNDIKITFSDRSSQTIKDTNIIQAINKYKEISEAIKKGYLKSLKLTKDDGSIVDLTNNEDVKNLQLQDLAKIEIVKEEQKTGEQEELSDLQKLVLSISRIEKDQADNSILDIFKTLNDNLKTAKALKAFEQAILEEEEFRKMLRKFLPASTDGNSYVEIKIMGEGWFNREELKKVTKDEFTNALKRMEELANSGEFPMNKFKSGSRMWNHLFEYVIAIDEEKLNDNKDIMKGIEREVVKALANGDTKLARKYEELYEAATEDGVMKYDKLERAINKAKQDQGWRNLTAEEKILLITKELKNPSEEVKEAKKKKKQNNKVKKNPPAKSNPRNQKIDANSVFKSKVNSYLESDSCKESTSKFYNQLKTLDPNGEYFEDAINRFKQENEVYYNTIIGEAYTELDSSHFDTYDEHVFEFLNTYLGVLFEKKILVDKNELTVRQGNDSIKIIKGNESKGKVIYTLTRKKNDSSKEERQQIKGTLLFGSYLRGELEKSQKKNKKLTMAKYFNELKTNYSYWNDIFNKVAKENSSSTP